MIQTTASYSQLISSIEESATLAMAARVRELKAQGKNVIGLTLGEPDFDTPTHIREAAKKALDEGFTHYPPVDGLPELKQAIIDKFKRENGLSYTAKQIMVSTGAKQSLYNVIMAMLNPGDEVLLPTPFWVSYEAMVRMAQGVPVYVGTGIASGYKVQAQDLEAAITPRTRLLIFSSPSNPSGSMYTKEEFAAIVEVLERYPQIYIIADEIYEHLAYDATHISIGSFESIFERVVTVNGFAKGFAMTGWRLGYIGAFDTELVRLANNVQGQTTSGANSFAQKGAVAALTETMQPTWDMREEFRARRDLLYPLLKKIEGLEVNLPEGAFYFYPDFRHFIGKSTPEGVKISDSDQLCFYLIDSVGLALVPGSAFGTATHARISYAYAKDVLLEGVNRLASALERLS